jgi:hypothetical protein
VWCACFFHRLLTNETESKECNNCNTFFSYTPWLLRTATTTNIMTFEFASAQHLDSVSFHFHYKPCGCLLNQFHSLLYVKPRFVVRCYANSVYDVIQWLGVSWLEVLNSTLIQFSFFFPDAPAVHNLEKVGKLPLISFAKSQNSRFRCKTFLICLNSCNILLLLLLGSQFFSH